MTKANFVLSVKLNDGRISELFNICGLKETTIENAIIEAKKMVESKIEDMKNYGEYHQRIWENAKPYSMRFDLLEGKTFKGRDSYIF